MAAIVVATDGSEEAGRALDGAIELAAATGDTLAVITVWRALQGDFGLVYPTAAMLQELLEAERAHAEAVLDDARRRAEDAGVLVETRLATGDPAERIIAFAHERRARLVAVGSHGHGAVMSLLAGSVSSAVIRGAPCPVLVVHAAPESAAAPAPPRAVAARSR